MLPPSVHYACIPNCLYYIYIVTNAIILDIFFGVASFSSGVTKSAGKADDERQGEGIRAGGTSREALHAADSCTAGAATQYGERAQPYHGILSLL